MKKSLGAQTLIFPTPTWVVGTYDKDGRANAMTAAGGICCSIRPASPSRCARRPTATAACSPGGRSPSVCHRRATYERPITSGWSAAATRTVLATGLTPVRGELVDAPYVEEFPMVLECCVLHVFELGLHTQFVGQIMDVKVDEAVLGSQGRPEIEKVRPFVFSPGDRVYHRVGAFLGHAFAIGKET